MFEITWNVRVSFESRGTNFGIAFLKKPYVFELVAYSSLPTAQQPTAKQPTAQQPTAKQPIPLPTRRGFVGGAGGRQGFVGGAAIAGGGLPRTQTPLQTEKKWEPAPRRKCG